MPLYRRQYALLGCILALVLLFPLSLFGQTYTQWDGSKSTAWRDTANWDKGVPDSTMSARISTYITYYSAHIPVPSLSLDTARTKDLQVQQNGFLYFDSLGVLVVHGSSVTIQNLGGIFLGYGRLISRANITFMNGGTFNAEAGTLEFAGVTWNNKSGSTFNAGASTVIFEGSSNQSLIDSSGGLTFYNLEIRTQGTVTLSGNITVTNSLSVASGCTVNIPAGYSFNISDSCTVSMDGTVMGAGTYPTGLPVQMTSFTATANRLDATLRWSTATEVNNFGFEVERRSVSQHGTRNPEPGTFWAKVGFVRGSGTSTSPREYSFVDSNIPAGRYAYRIKQIDLDGAAIYHDAAEVEVGLAPKELSLGSNYPNPFNPTTTIEFTLPESGKARLTVFNMIGQVIATLFDQNAEAGRLYRATFFASTLPSGLYFYRLEFGNQSIVKRMTLVK